MWTKCEQTPKCARAPNSQMWTASPKCERVSNIRLSKCEKPNVITCDFSHLMFTFDVHIWCCSHLCFFVVHICVFVHICQVTIVGHLSASVILYNRTPSHKPCPTPAPHTCPTPAPHLCPTPAPQQGEVLFCWKTDRGGRVGLVCATGFYHGCVKVTLAWWP